MLKTAAVATIALSLFAGSASAMSISFEWGQTKSCFDRHSPPITVSDVPKGTATLKFTLDDLNAMDFNHGGGSVAYTGKNSLPYGAFSYRGPCPPDGTHTYRITVKALDASGKTLDSAKAKRRFPK